MNLGITSPASRNVWLAYLVSVLWCCVVSSPLMAQSTTVTQTAQPGKVEYALALHGGAGWEPDKLTEADTKIHEQAMRQALDAGRQVLAAGGTAMDAVEVTIRALEDNPLYNAGRGAVFNNVGQHELDAAIMDGLTRKGGAVAGLTTVKNPISLARLVMSQTKHVLLIGSGAEKFADEMQGNRLIERVPNSYFSTEVRRKEWEETQRREAAESSPKAAEPDPKGAGTKSTVGCVALDKHGNLAAGTSTGGLTNKKWGRVGAVPILGAGTYADNRTCAFSGTGTGEVFLLNSSAFQVHAMMLMQHKSLERAVTELIDQVMPEDSGGVIAIDAQGHIVMRCNTPGMARAAVDSTGKVQIHIAR